MDEIRCPMCSRPNPADEDVCGFCEARLRPLQAPLPSEELPEKPIEPFVFQERDDVSELGESSQEDTEDTETDAVGDEWIDDLRVDSIEHEIEDYDESDWESEHGIPSGVETETSEWLSRIRDHVDSTKFEENQISDKDLEPAKTGVLPGMFSSEEGAEVPLPDWLLIDEEDGKDSSSEQVVQPFEEQEPPAKVDSDIEDLPNKKNVFEIDEISSEIDDQSTGLTGMLAWLSKQSDDSPGLDDDKQVGRSELDATIRIGESPSNMDGFEFQEAPETVADKQESGKTLQPEWLTELEQKTDLDDLETTSSDYDLKPWLESDETQDVETELPEAADEQILDWFSSSEEELPDWLLNEEAVGKPGATIPGDVLSKITDQAVPVDRKSLTPEEQELKEIQDIISALDRETDKPTQNEQAIGVGDLQEDLSWLDELEAAYPDLGEMDDDKVAMAGHQIDEALTDETDIGIEVDLPDWLAAAAVQEGTQELTTPGPLKDDLSEPSDELTAADLPDWLESIRPIATLGAAASVVSDEVEGEQAGPLAGLKGVLQAEPDISYTQTPPAYSSRLLVTDKQQADAETLRKLIAVEEDTKPIPSTPVITSQYVLRIVIFIVLSVAILANMIFGIPRIGLPVSAAATSDAVAVNELVESMSIGAPVLIAIDYEPGFSGEMDVYISLILEHLMSKDTFITFVSTSPTGPLLASRLIDNLNLTSDYGYSSPEQYINLGFVPGGVIGLLSFAVAPHETSPFTMDGEDAWEDTSLSTVNSLSEFAMLVLATENPDTARAWIEQVQPRLGETPFVVVASAQVEPVVRPYYESNPQQVQALLSGLVVAGSYSNLNPSLAQDHVQTYWPPFSIAGLAIVVIFLVGGGIYASMRLFKDRSTGRKGVE